MVDSGLWIVLTTEQDEPRRQAEPAPHGLLHRRYHPELPLRRHRPREGPHLRDPVPPGGHVRLTFPPNHVVREKKYR